MINGFIDSNLDLDAVGIKKTSLLVKNGLISEVGNNPEKSLINVPNDLFVVPGFIDEHIHGSNGFDVMEGNYDSLHTISKAILMDGVVAYCPTTMTMSKDEIIKALTNINEYIKKNPLDTAKVLGAHLEGPFISKKYKGAQEEINIKKCDVNLFKEFEDVCHSIKEVTFAYEENGKELLRYLVSKNITPSIGHTNCKAELLKEGIEEGISCATHTFNAMSPFLHREVGTVGTVLLSDKVNCELICDLIHVCPDAIRLLYKCKGKKIILITDSMEAKHMKDGIYALGGQKVIVKDNAARLSDGTLAGSILTMNKAIKNIRDVLSLSFTDAIDLATINPARNIHEDKHLGSIKAGKNASFAIVDKDFDVKATIVNGEILFKKEDYSWLR